jgi:hypothetical protein
LGEVAKCRIGSSAITKSSAKTANKTIVRALEAQPHLDLEAGQITQHWGTLTDLPIASGEQARLSSTEALN